MTATRPCNPAYLDVLRQVAELGEATCQSIGDMPKASKMMNNMSQYGWLLTVGFAESETRGRGRPTLRVYRLTAAGRAALETGVVEDGVANRFTISNFNGKRKSPTPEPAERCQHHWLVDSTLMQHHVCTKCQATKDQPFTYGLQLAKVGLGKVRPSTRYGAKLMEVGVEVGGTAVDLEESDG